MSNLEEFPKPDRDSPQPENAPEANDEATFDDANSVTSSELEPNDEKVESETINADAGVRPELPLQPEPLVPEPVLTETNVATDEVESDFGTGVFADGTNPEDHLNQPVKKGEVNRSATVMAIIAFSLLVLAILVGGAMAFTGAAQENTNHAVIIDKMKADGANIVGDKVSEGATGDYLLIEMEGQFLKCDVMVVNNETPVGLVFCQPGAPAVFSVPVPNDPDNILTSMFNKAEQ